MSEEFKSSLENTYISAKENIKNFFLKIKTPLKIIVNIIFSALIVYAVFNYSKIAEIYIPDIFKFIAIHTWESAITLFILLAILLCFKKYLATYAQNLFSSLTNKYFMLSLAGLAIVGASAALFIPSYTNWFRENDSAKTQQPISTPQPTQSGQDTGNQQKQESKNSASELRGHLLYITGGVIAVLGLIETNRKNSQDHIRQVHAARRDRYIEAVDKLSSKSAPVRLGGVYALVALVDEWLEDDNIDKETQIKEGQVIINNLCAYIRSPFKLAEKRTALELDTQPDNYQGNFSEDQVKLFEEQDVRRSIFNEISIRLPLLNEKEKLDYITWDAFEFNFQKSTVFYPLDRLTFFRPDFRNSKFFVLADFDLSDFRGIPRFTGAQYFGDANFSAARFQTTALFQDSCFEKELNFQATTLEAGAIFDSSFFKGPTIITPVLQDGRVSFDGSMFNCSSEHKFPDSDHLDIPKIDIRPVTLVSKRRCKRYKAKIPVNSHLYDPDSWNEEEKKYDCFSDPAQ